MILQLGFVRGFVFTLFSPLARYAYHAFANKIDDNGYKGIMILCELPLHDSSTSLYVLFCIHIGFRDIMIL